MGAGHCIGRWAPYPSSPRLAGAPVSQGLPTVLVVGRALGSRRLALHASVATAQPRWSATDRAAVEPPRRHRPGAWGSGSRCREMSPAQRWWEGIWDAGVPSARGSMVRDSGPLARPSPRRRQQFSLYTLRIKRYAGATDVCRRLPPATPPNTPTRRCRPHRRDERWRAVYGGCMGCPTVCRPGRPPGTSPAPRGPRV
jgi:hypothetical protein